MLLERDAVGLELIVDVAATPAKASLLVPVRCQNLFVTPDLSPTAPSPPIHTAWLPRSCSSGDMAGATMQYGSSAGGATVAEVPYPPAPR